MKAIKMINNYFFGMEEIGTEATVWFYGFLVAGMFGALFLLFVKTTF